MRPPCASQKPCSDLDLQARKAVVRHVRGHPNIASLMEETGASQDGHLPFPERIQGCRCCSPLSFDPSHRIPESSLSLESKPVASYETLHGTHQFRQIARKHRMSSF